MNLDQSLISEKGIATRCLMCDAETETVEHFLLRCDYLSEVRDPALQQLEKVLTTSLPLSPICNPSSVPSNPTLPMYNSTLNTKPVKPSTSFTSTYNTVQILLDPTYLNVPQNVVNTIEAISRKLIFSLHSVRAKFIRANQV